MKNALALIVLALGLSACTHHTHTTRRIVYRTVEKAPATSPASSTTVVYENAPVVRTVVRRHYVHYDPWYPPFTYGIHYGHGHGHGHWGWGLHYRHGYHHPWW